MCGCIYIYTYIYISEMFGPKLSSSRVLEAVVCMTIATAALAAMIRPIILIHEQRMNSYSSLPASTTAALLFAANVHAPSMGTIAGIIQDQVGGATEMLECATCCFDGHLALSGWHNCAIGMARWWLGTCRSSPAARAFRKPGGLVHGTNWI